ncbi:MAG: hypothetical protein R3E58_07740 [Phycisphaerae bacterium]
MNMSGVYPSTEISPTAASRVCEGHANFFHDRKVEPAKAQIPRLALATVTTYGTYIDAGHGRRGQHSTSGYHDQEADDRHFRHAKAVG